MATRPPSKNTTHRPTTETRKEAGEKRHSGARRAETFKAEDSFGRSFEDRLTDGARIKSDDKRAAPPPRDDGWVKAYHAEKTRLEGDKGIG